MEPSVIKNYINGAWVDAENSGCLDVENPSTGEVLASCPLSTAAEADRAVAAAAEAFPAWSQTPVARRVLPLQKLAVLLRENEEAISRTLTEEMGKSLPDARAEMKRTIENTEVACGMPIMQQGDKVFGCAKGIDGDFVGLTIPQVIKILGTPKVRAKSGEQTVLLYPGLELTSNDGITISHQGRPAGL